MHAGNQAADLVLHGGAVVTMDAARRRVSAVAVRAGRIIAVGTDADARGWAGPGTEVVDLRGRMLLPGFVDAHVHPGHGGGDLLRCDLRGSEDAREYVRLVGEYAAAHPERPWILGGGWTMPAFPRGVPEAAVLDAVVADRPVFLPNRDGHSAWVNSRALELAGITAGTPDPPDGRIERDAQGRPSGALHEGAMRLVGDLVPATTPAELREGLLAGQAYLHARGITGWQDAIVGPSDLGEDFYDTYLDLDATGRLTGRVVGALWWQRGQGEEQVGGLLERRAKATGRRFRASSVKIMQDGVCETFTAALLDPYLDAHGHPTTNRGISFVDPEALKRYVTRLDREGFQVHFHALGDRAVRESLDAIAAARAEGGRTDRRHHLAHIQVVHPADVPRFRELWAVANCQPLWARNEPQMTELTIPFLGTERAGWQYPFASLERSGAALAFGSDWPVSTPNPLQLIHTAVNRQPPGTAGEEVEVFLPEERLPLSTALHAATMGSAYVNHMEQETGSIEPGKLADLVVLDRDLFAAPSEEIHTARVLLTLVEGERVYEAQDF